MNWATKSYEINDSSQVFRKGGLRTGNHCEQSNPDEMLAYPTMEISGE